MLHKFIFMLKYCHENLSRDSQARKYEEIHAVGRSYGDGMVYEAVVPEYKRKLQVICLSVKCKLPKY
jgi:hypothetical protein